MNTDVVVVVAGNYEQFMHWARENAKRIASNCWQTKDGKHRIVCATTCDSLQGITAHEIIRVGTWHRRDDSCKIIDYATMCRRPS